MRPSSPHPHRASRAGFSLLEVMTVVIVVGILVTLGLPSIGYQLKSRRTNQAAHEVAMLYRRARAMALGRGAATLVRFDAANYPRGHVDVREAINGGSNTDGTCATAPSTGCQSTDWHDSAALGVPGVADSVAHNRIVDKFDPADLDVYSTVSLAFAQAAGTSRTFADICFTPLGRPYVRYVDTGAFAPLAEVPVITVARADGVGFARSVLVAPSGGARLSL